jgi:probable HAF family extracellular repeat protein
MTDLGTLPGSSKALHWPTDINNRGQIIGGKFGGQAHGWVWEDGRMTDLGSLGSGYAQVTAINERGQIVGWSYTKTGKAHAVLWTLKQGLTVR